MTAESAIRTEWIRAIVDKFAPRNSVERASVALVRRYLDAGRIEAAASETQYILQRREDMDSHSRPPQDH